MDGWVVVVPVKHPGRGKTRMADAFGPHRPALARAMALDTIAAALGADLVTDVVVVTDDPDLAAGTGARVVSDPGAGLNQAIVVGLDACGRQRDRAVLAGDLPGARPCEIDAALALAAAVEVGVVGDADGTGTTLLTMTAGTTARPRFGRDSLRAHVAAGAQPLTVDPASGLRRDADRPEHLATLGSSCGPLTTALLASVAIT